MALFNGHYRINNFGMHSMRFMAPYPPFPTKNKLPYHYQPVLVCMVCAYRIRNELVCIGSFDDVGQIGFI